MSNQSKNVKSEISELEMCNVGADMPQEAAQISENSYFNDAPYPDENPYFHASPFGGYYPQRYVFQDTVEGALPITLGEGWLSNALTELCSRVHDRARFGNDAHMITLSDLVNKGPRVKNDSTSTAKAFCRFCANSGYEFEHPMTDSNGATLCPHLRKLVCQKCSQTGDNAHTLRKCPLYGKVPPAVISNDHAYNYTLPPRGIDAPNWSPFFERAEFNTPEIAPEHEVQEGASGGNSNDWVDEFLQKCSLANKDDGYNSASPPRGGASNGSAFWAEKKSAEDAFFGADTP